MDSERRGYVEQVGGTHYQSSYQHWDWVEDMGMGYLEGCATKYVARWRKKDGLKDLQKARTYIEKLARRHDRGRRNRSFTVLEVESTKYESFHRFCTINDVQGDERDICHTMLYWHSKEDIQHAWRTLNRLIEAEETRLQVK